MASLLTNLAGNCQGRWLVRGAGPEKFAYPAPFSPLFGSTFSYYPAMTDVFSAHARRSNAVLRNLAATAARPTSVLVGTRLSQLPRPRVANVNVWDKDMHDVTEMRQASCLRLTPPRFRLQQLLVAVVPNLNQRARSLRRNYPTRLGTPTQHNACSLRLLGGMTWMPVRHQSGVKRRRHQLILGPDLQATMKACSTW
jgi:hypothetical protein